MEYDDHADAVEREVELLANALDAALASRTIPTCPEWTPRDLAIHLGEFTGFWTHVLCEATGRPKSPYAELDGPDGIDRWYGQLGGRLVSELRATPPDTPVWTWVETERTARFIARRCANELAFHRYDAQSATASCEPIPSDVAIDAIDEIFVMMRAWGPPPGGHVGKGEVLELVAIDSGARRTIVLAPGGPHLTGDPVSPDLSLVGAASDLSLMIFKRPRLGDVETNGAESVLARWYEEFTFE